MLTGRSIILNKNRHRSRLVDLGITDTFTGSGRVDAHAPDTTAFGKHPWTSSTGTISSNAARHTETLGAEKIVNGNFSAALGAEWDLTLGGGGGSIAIVGGELVLTQVTSTWIYVSQDFTSVAGTYYVATVDCDTSATTNRFTVGTTQNGAEIFSKATLAASNTFYFKATGTTTWITLVDGQGDALDSVWDNISVKPITLSSILTLSNLGFPEGRFWYTPANVAAGELAGIVILANDSVASTDGLFCKANRTSGKLHIFKRVAGVDTDLINTTITYSEGAQGCVVHDKSEGKIWAFYNNAIVGEAQALTDVSGTWHGILTTGTATITAVGFAPLGYGAELLVNGNMEAGNPPSNWVDKGGATLSSVADERTGGSGTAALHGITGAGSASVASQTITTVVGSLYRVDGWIKNIDGTGVLFVIRTGTGISGGVLNNSAAIAATTWTNETFYFIAQDVTSTMTVNVNGGAGKIGRFDDNSIKQIQ